MQTRLSGWISEKEMEALDRKATELHASRNYVVRLAIRQYLGIDKKGNQMPPDITLVTDHN